MEMIVFKHYEIVNLDEYAQQLGVTPRQVVLETFRNIVASEWIWNWLFLSTSGIHGDNTTLDEVEEGETLITVLMVLPRTCVMYYGNITITANDVPELQTFVQKTIEGVIESQQGNVKVEKGVS